MRFAPGLLANVMEGYFPVEDPNPIASHGISTGFGDNPTVTPSAPVHTCAVLAK